MISIRGNINDKKTIKIGDYEDDPNPSEVVIRKWTNEEKFKIQEISAEAMECYEELSTDTEKIKLKPNSQKKILGLNREMQIAKIVYGAVSIDGVKVTEELIKNINSNHVIRTLADEIDKYNSEVSLENSVKN